MPKILLPHGEPGREEGRWNWCDQDEPVGVHGFRCSSPVRRCICGCGITFTGTRSNKGTTLATVVEIPQIEWDEHRRAFVAFQIDAWPGLPEHQARNVALFESLTKKLKEFPAGTVLAVEKLDDGFQLIKQGK